jgi:hypothetical protein
MALLLMGRKEWRAAAAAAAALLSGACNNIFMVHKEEFLNLKLT